MYTDENLDLLNGWFSTLEIPLAFELEKLLRNTVLDPVEIYSCRSKVDFLICDTETSRACLILSEFGKLLSQDEDIQENAEKALNVYWEKALQAVG